MSFIISQVFRHQILITCQVFINRFESRYPIAMLYFSTALQVVLASYEVPHEVPPVHEVELIGEEELEVLPLCRHVHHCCFSALRIKIWHIMSLYIYPLFIPVGILRTIHSWEQHILFVGIAGFSRD